MRATVFAAALLACGGAVPPPQAADYDASCVADSDCVQAIQAEYCGFGCGSAHCLSAAGAASFTADQEDYGDPECKEVGRVACDGIPATTCTCTDSVCTRAPGT